MTAEALRGRFAALCAEDIPGPGCGGTPGRHRRIFSAGREDLSLAKLAEAHWDAVSILREARREPFPGARYAVWASEMPGQPLEVRDGTLSGVKAFCSGAGLVDRALLTVGETLLEVDLRTAPERVTADASGWVTEAFRETQTHALTFADYPIATVIGKRNWYVERVGFWQGACGPAAAWAGGAAGLLDYALAHPRANAHSLAHLGAMAAEVWVMQAALEAVGREFDAAPRANAMVRALQVRHVMERGCAEVVRRFGRMLGPGPLARDAAVVRRVAELELFVRQSHAERDLEALGRAVLAEARG